MVPAEQTNPSKPVAQYLQEISRWRFPPEGDLAGSTEAERYSDWRQVVVDRVPGMLIDGSRAIVTRMRMTASSRRRLRRAKGPVRLHIGCGETHLADWINLDLAGAHADVVWDLRRPLPFTEGTVDAIFHEHFLEHLPIADAVDSLRECHRLLRPGGVLRFGVPDFRQHAQSYAADDGFIASIRPGRPTPILAMNELVYSYGHRSIWDEALATQVLDELGFVEVAAMTFGRSRLDPVPDSPERRVGTLYVEGVKPDAA